MKRTILGCAVLIVSMVGCKLFHREPGEADCPIFKTKMGPRPGEDQHARAGYPREVSDCAHPSDTGAYVAYPVGGGEAIRHKGCEPGPAEGVWGWDYQGRCIPSNVELLWTAGRYQGGIDGYNGIAPNIMKKIHERHEKHEEGHEGGEGHGAGGHNGDGHGGSGAHKDGGHGSAGSSAGQSAGGGHE
jgi:hypothetical protein